jgi:hypothetical protein
MSGFPEPAQVATIACVDDWYERETALIREPAALNWSYERGRAKIHERWREGFRRPESYRWRPSRRKFF